MQIKTIHLREQVLNTADAGVSLASQTLCALSEPGNVRLDFSVVERMTPSFANAFVMTLLHSLALANLQSRVELANRNPHVASAMRESVRRYERGMRLSTQQLDDMAVPIDSLEGRRTSAATV